VDGYVKRAPCYAKSAARDFDSQPRVHRQIPAETEPRSFGIRVLPGTEVKVDTVLLEMTNPQVEQAASMRNCN